MNTVVAVLTSHNRVTMTVRCLERLEAAAEQTEVDLRAVLIDDGSSDGTAQAVAERFAWVRVLRSDGSLYWTRGMHRAIREALAMGQADYILWLNDDTMLLPGALGLLLATASAQQQQHGQPALVVGAITNPVTGQLTYSGQVAVGRWRRFTFRKVFSATEALPCDTMNGNVVLLPVALVHQVGNLDPAFEHGGGDIDYGLRVHQAGLPMVVAPGVAGHCSSNPAAGGYTDVSAPLRQRWRHMLNSKGLPVRTWLPLTRKHGGLLWPLYFAWPYFKVVGSSWAAALKKR